MMLFLRAVHPVPVYVIHVSYSFFGLFVSFPSVSIGMIPSIAAHLAPVLGVFCTRRSYLED
jgi:hypothetical protein